LACSVSFARTILVFSREKRFELFDLNL